MKSLVSLSVLGDNYRKIKSGTEMRPYDHSVEDLMKSFTVLSSFDCHKTQQNKMHTNKYYRCPLVINSVPQYWSSGCEHSLPFYSTHCKKKGMFGIVREMAILISRMRLILSLKLCKPRDLCFLKYHRYLCQLGP